MTYYNTQGDLVEKFTSESQDDFDNQISAIDAEINSFPNRTIIFEMIDKKVEKITLGMDLNKFSKNSYNLLIFLKNIEVSDTDNSLIFLDYTQVKDQIPDQQISPAENQIVTKVSKTLDKLNKNRTHLIHKEIREDKIQIQIDMTNVFAYKEDLVLFVTGFENIKDKTNSYILASAGEA